MSLARYRQEVLGELPATVSRSTPKKDYKAEFEQQLELAGILVETEFVFAPPRRYRADWHVIGTTILIEFEGGLFLKGKGGHSSVSGIIRDIEKANLATISGWTQIRIAPNHVTSGQALKWVEEAILTSK